MDREHLESAGRNYPYMYQHGLYGIPFGLMLSTVGLSNLEETSIGLFVGGLVVTLAAFGGVFLYYQRTLGRVTITRSMQVRYSVGILACYAVFVAADQLARTVLGRPPTEPVSTPAAAWALGVLAFHAITLGVRIHHVIVWGSLLVAGCLPIWGVGPDRDAVAYFPMAAATVVSGLVDHVLLVRRFRSLLGVSSAGA